MMLCLYTLLQLGRIYLDMLNVYKVLSENISNAVSINGIVNELTFYMYMYSVYNSMIGLLCM